MPKIIHMTDLHICPEGEKVVNLDPDRLLLQCINSINAKHSDADLCVITGDLVNRGELTAYHVLRRRLEELRVPWRLLLGNHDDRKNFCAAFPATPVDSSGFVQWIEDVGDLRLVFLDTLDSDTPGGGGVLCEERMQWLKERLTEARNKRVYLFMHHPPKSVHAPWFDNMLLKTSDSFMSLVADYPGIAHIVFGHLHLTLTGHWGTTSFSCNRGTCHKIALTQDDRKVDYVKIGPAYDILHIDGEELVIHHVDPAGTMELLASEEMDPTGPGSQFRYPPDGSGATVEC